MTDYEANSSGPTGTSEEGYETTPSADGPLEDEKRSRDGGALEKHVSMASVNNISSIPNGGLKAWLQVLGAFFLMFNTWGISNTFGVYQTYYETGELFTASSSQISWIGSIQAMLLLLVGALTGPIYDAGYVRTLLFTGTFLTVFGQMMLSLCHTYWQVMLSQAICLGIGAGFLFVPAVAIISTYFNTRIGTAIGLAVSGSSLGGVIYPIVFHRLQPSIGFGWTTRVLGFMELAMLLVSLACMRVRVLPAHARKLIDWSAFREPAYMLWVAGCFFGFMGLYIPFFYIQYYSIATSITDNNLGFYLLAILNSASVFGRIIPNFIADTAGPLNIMIPCAFISGLLILCLISVHNVAGIVIFALLYGFFSGTFVSIPPTVFVRLSPNRGMIGTRMGMGFAMISIGAVVGAPIGGAILNSKNNGYYFTGLWIFSGLIVLVGGVFITLTRMVKADWKLMAKT